MKFLFASLQNDLISSLKKACARNIKKLIHTIIFVTCMKYFCIIEDL